MNHVRPYVWHWSSRHPQRTDEDDLAGHRWGPEVSSYAFALDGRVVLVHPVISPGGIDELLGDQASHPHRLHSVSPGSHSRGAVTYPMSVIGRMLGWRSEITGGTTGVPRFPGRQRPGSSRSPTTPR